MNLQTDVPLINVPLATTDGRANPIWFQFFVQLWRRTGNGQGTSTDDIRLSDIDIDSDSVDADLQAAINSLDETNTIVQATIDDGSTGQLATSIKNMNLALQLASSDDGITSVQEALVSKIAELSLIIEDAQDVAKRLRRAIDDAVIDGLTVIEPIRSMAYQDANKVAIGGGAINNTSIGATTPAAAAVTTLSASGQITSTLAIGTAPFSITSTTVVPNLNVSQLLGGTWAIPGAIGSTTPNSGAFTTLTTTGNAALGTTSSSWGSGFRAVEVGAQGNAYFSATSGSFNSLLTNNAYFDGSNWKYVRTAAATHIEQITGTLKFMTAPSGSAGGNITWTQQLQVDTNGATARTMILTAATPTVAAGQVGFGNTTATTVGAAGGASALPATPVGYLAISVGGTNYKIPYYNS